LILFGFLSQSSKRKAVAGVVSVAQGGVAGQDVAVSRRGDLVRFRAVFYACVTARADELFELTEALVCTEGPVRTLVELALAPEHRRGHGALYDGNNHGRIEVARLRRELAGLPLRASAGAGAASDYVLHKSHERRRIDVGRTQRRRGTE
jgi:DDE superfamily endonuclease